MSAAHSHLVFADGGCESRLVVSYWEQSATMRHVIYFSVRTLIGARC